MSAPFLSPSTDGPFIAPQRVDPAPRWFDEAGSPRFVPFHPVLCAHPRADQAALVRTACHGCGQSFLVALTWISARDGAKGIAPLTMGNLVASNAYLYGAPPPSACCRECGHDVKVLALVNIWVREHDTWLRLDDMSRAAIPIVEPRLHVDVKAH